MADRKRVKVSPVDKYGSQLPDGIPADIAILAGIGGVCLQWARLELGALSVIGALEQQYTEETWLRYGGLDLLPRLNLAIRLADQSGQPASFGKKMRSIRAQVQGKRGLAVKRNEVVHGAHKNLEGQVATLTMTRYPEGSREIEVDPFSLNELATEIHELANEAFELFEKVGKWNIRQAVRKVKQERK